MPTPQKAPQRILVWDLLVRLGHWTIVISFVTGYLFVDKFPFHAYAGYVILALVTTRIVWGFVGTNYARFSAFTYSLKETWHYTMQAMRFGEAREYLSHNPMGAIMVYVLLTVLLANGIVGMMLYAAQQALGPLEDIVPYDWEDTLLVIHALLGKVLLGCAALHVIGVIWASWWHRENYVLAMITGYKFAYTRRKHREIKDIVAGEESLHRHSQIDQK